MQTVNDVLAERAVIYGSYISGVLCREQLINSIEHKYMECHNGDKLPADIKVMFSDIVLKVMRAASDPTHIDSWIDLAGYATLIKEVMEEQNADGR